ncbi:hypothetical protein FPOAC2_05776 [Fusarium poae]
MPFMSVSKKCVVVQSRKSPVKKERREHEKRKSESLQDDNLLENTKREDVDSPSTLSETRFLKQIQGEIFTAPQHLLRDFVNTTSPAYQLEEVKLFENCYEELDEGDTMEWSFLEDPPMCSKTASSLVDSGFHDESWHTLEPSFVTTPSSSSSAYADKHTLDTLVCPAKTEGINETGNDLLDNLFALPFDFLRHI